MLLEMYRYVRIIIQYGEYSQYFVITINAAAAAKSLQSCPTLWDPINCSPQGSPRPWDSPGKNTGVGCRFLLHAWKRKVKVKSLSRVRLLVTPWTVAHQAPPSMGFSRQEYWSGVPLPSPMHESEKWKGSVSFKNFIKMYKYDTIVFSLYS